MDEDKEKLARKIRLRIMMLQKELASSQHHASLGGFLQAGRPSNLRNQAERDRQRLEGEITKLREQLEALTSPEAAPSEKKPAPEKKAAPRKKPVEKKASPKKAVKKKADTKKPAKKKAAPKKAASKKTVKKKASPKKAKKSR